MEQNYNVHLHIFTSACAPPEFLKVEDSKFLKIISKLAKSGLENDKVRYIVRQLDKILPDRSRTERANLRRKIAFLGISSQYRQKDIFEIALENAKNSGMSEPRLITHTLDMDYMDNSSRPEADYNTQLHEVIHIKHFYPDNIFPFISVDPRARSGETIVEWIKPYFENGVKSKVKNKLIPLISGIKIYPAHGFFPFDTRLEHIYAYAEEHKIPLMFHCTRVGSQYIGSQIESLIPMRPSMIMPKSDESENYYKAKRAQDEIYLRIQRYYQKDGWIKNSNLGINEFACDLFSHPQNYVPVMCRFPKLKICLAHMGGSEEVEYMYPENQLPANPKKDLRELIEIWETDRYNWAWLIKELMKEFPSLYTDISSTITHLGEQQILHNIIRWINEKDFQDKNLGDRILFGTDYFMTETCIKEINLYKLMSEKLYDWKEKMMSDNIEEYLFR